MTREFNPHRPVRTRNGRQARIICMDLKDGDEPRLVAAVRCPETGREGICIYTREGRYYSDAKHSVMDLVNTPPLQLREGDLYRDQEIERLREAMRLAVDIITDSWGEDQMDSGDCQAVNVLRAALGGENADG